TNDIMCTCDCASLQQFRRRTEEPQPVADCADEQPPRVHLRCGPTQKYHCGGPVGHALVGGFFVTEAVHGVAANQDEAGVVGGSDVLEIDRDGHFRRQIITLECQLWLTPQVGEILDGITVGGKELAESVVFSLIEVTLDKDADLPLLWSHGLFLPR